MLYLLVAFCESCRWRTSPGTVTSAEMIAGNLPDSDPEKAFARPLARRSLLPVHREERRALSSLRSCNSLNPLVCQGPAIRAD